MLCVLFVIDGSLISSSLKGSAFNWMLHALLFLKTVEDIILGENKLNWAFVIYVCPLGVKEWSSGKYQNEDEMKNVHFVYPELGA